MARNLALTLKCSRQIGERLDKLPYKILIHRALDRLLEASSQLAFGNAEGDAQGFAIGLAWNWPQFRCDKFSTGAKQRFGA